MVERESFAVVERNSCHSHSVIHKFNTSVTTVFLMSSHHFYAFHGNSIPNAQPLKSCG